jgi:glutaredoxin
MLSGPPILRSKCRTFMCSAVMTTVTLYTKDDCHLCEEARELLEAANLEFDFEFVQLDITQDEALRDLYGERIPVVAVDGAELFELRVDEWQLRSVLTEQTESRTAGAPDLLG